MITFALSIVALVLGYLLYGRYVERVFGPDDRPTPAVARADGIDFVVLPSWKIFMIQFLNIAGTGPIFGAIMGAQFGPSAYLWIVLGCIFAGATHDYLAGMLSLREGGVGLPELVGHYLGVHTKRVMLSFTMVLLLLVGAVFVYSPAIILSGMTAPLTHLDPMTVTLLWCGVIFFYYIIATMMPVDKIIGRIYPLFAASLLFMAAGLMVVLLLRWPSLPELTDGLASRHPSGQGLFPALFITIACGAISGFHATQSPLMARCMKSERMGRPVFYGAMITEGIVALIWATIASYFFYGGEAARLGASLQSSAPEVVALVSRSWLGVAGGVLALFGVVAAPITSGDTALRSARLIVAEALGIEQRSYRNRFLVCIPLFIITFCMLWVNIADKDGFNTIWQYFGWANQALSVFTLWTLTVYLSHKRKPFIITIIPAMLMTCVCTTFILVSPTALGGTIIPAVGYGIGVATAVAAAVGFYVWRGWDADHQKPTN